MTCGHCGSKATEPHCKNNAACPWIRCLACSWITDPLRGRVMTNNPKESTR